MAANPQGSLELTVERRDGVTVVRAEGEIDLDNADQLGATLRGAASDSTEGVVLDLVGVPFMDSSGLKALLLASGALGARLSLAAGPGCRRYPDGAPRPMSCCSSVEAVARNSTWAPKLWPMLIRPRKYFRPSSPRFVRYSWFSRAMNSRVSVSPTRSAALLRPQKVKKSRKPGRDRPRQPR